MITQVDIKAWTANDVTIRLLKNLKQLKQDMIDYYESGEMARTPNLLAAYQWQMGRMQLIESIMNLDIVQEDYND